MKRVISCATIDNLFTGSEEHIPVGCKFILGDVSNLEILNSLKREYFDGIFHIAGQSSIEVSFDDAGYGLHTNTQSTILLLKFAREIGCRKFIYASSMSTYGEIFFLCVAKICLQFQRAFMLLGN